MILCEPDSNMVHAQSDFLSMIQHQYMGVYIGSVNDSLRVPIEYWKEAEIIKKHYAEWNHSRAPVTIEREEVKKRK